MTPSSPAAHRAARGSRLRDTQTDAPAAERQPLPWRPALLAAVLSAAGGFWGLGTPQYWFDEAATVSAVERPWDSLLGMVQKVDAVHALYYVVMHPWAAVFGTSEFSLRTPSTIALAVMALLLTRIGMAYARRYQPSRVVLTGVFVAVLAATLPGLTWAGQEARGYAMGAMSLTIAWWCFERYREHGRTWEILGFTVAMAAGVGFSMYVALLLPLFFLRSLRWGRRSTLSVLVASAVAGCVCLPLVFLGAEQSSQVSWINITTTDVVKRMALKTFFLSPRNRLGPLNDVVAEISPYLLALALVLVVCAVVFAGRRGRGIVLWLLGLGLFPFVVILAAQLLGRQFFQERYLTFAAPILVLLLALGAAAIPWRAVGITLTVVFAALSFPSLVGQNGEHAKVDNYRTASEAAAQADTVIFMDDEARGIFIAYPPDHQVADPMLAVDQVDSATLWGQDQPGWWAWQLDETGKVAVVAFKPNPHYDAVLENLTGIGCKVTDVNLDSRFRVTNLQCPETLQQPAQVPIDPNA